jgi:hypothetical protein
MQHLQSYEIFEQMGLYNGAPLSTAEQAQPFWDNMDPNTRNLILGFGFSFLPGIGEFIAGGFLAANFINDWKQAKTDKDKKRIALTYLADIAIGAGLGKAIKSVANLGHAGMKGLSQKIYLGKPLNSNEIQAMKDLTDKSMNLPALLQQAKASGAAVAR